MNRLRVVLGLTLVLGLLLAVAVPTFAGKQGAGNGKDPPAWGHNKPDNPKHEQQPGGGNKHKDAPGTNDLADATSTPVPTDTTPITYTTTITLCHKPGTPAEKTLVLPASAGPGHLRHGDYEGECLEVTPTPTPTDTLPITNTEMITICHKPGTPAEKTLVLPAAALHGHLQHGDELGACPDAAVAAAPSQEHWKHGR